MCAMSTRLESLSLPRFCGMVKVSDILFPKEARTMTKVQKTYTPEFKREAVRLAQSSGKPIAQVARELGISDTSIHQWRKELTEYGPSRSRSGNETTSCSCTGSGSGMTGSI